MIFLKQKLLFLPLAVLLQKNGLQLQLNIQLLLIILNNFEWKKIFA